MENNRDDQSSMQNKNQQQNSGGMKGGTGENQGNTEENPQEGEKWDNYQTRELSSEGSGKIQESDLLRADEANQQNTGSGSEEQR